MSTWHLVNMHTQQYTYRDQKLQSITVNYTSAMHKPKIIVLHKTNWNITSLTSVQIHIQTHTYTTVSAVRSVTVSSRPDRGLWFETVQPTVSRSYLPDGLAWPSVTLARSFCLFSVCFSLTHLLLHHHLPSAFTPCTKTWAHFLPQGTVNKRKSCSITVIEDADLHVISFVQRCDICNPSGSIFPLISVLCNMSEKHERHIQQFPSSSHMSGILYNRCTRLIYLVSYALLAMWKNWLLSE